MTSRPCSTTALFGCLCVLFCTMVPIAKGATTASVATTALSDNAPKMRGEFTQGGIIRGTTIPGTIIKLNDKEIIVNQEGQFVFGFGRDAKLSHTVSYQLPEQTTFQTLPVTLTAREYDIQRIEGVAKKYVSPAKEVLSRIRKDNVEIAKARATKSNLSAFTQDFIMPAQGRISGVYGSQRVFNGEPRRPHFGLDVAGPIGTPVIAPADGIVTLAHNDMYYSGGTLIIDHGLGLSSTFIHLSAIHVTVGQALKQGDLIADIGATGRVTGPHLDWRINWFKERLDPMLLISK